MARRDDSGWRDSALTEWHARNGFPCPAAGMVLPMIEYDRGQSVGLVNYVPRNSPLPNGPDVAAAYRAFGRLHNETGGAPLPFLTAVYDPRNWAMRLFPHNDAAQRLLGSLKPDPEPIEVVRRPTLTGLTPHWNEVPEYCFAELLYAMRGRDLPDLFGHGVEWHSGSWRRDEPIAPPAVQPFPCADMSARRREYEPPRAAPMRLKVPCLDVDLAVVDRDDNLALVADYKRRGAVCDVAGTNATALASLAGKSGPPVPAFMTRYHTDGGDWWFEAYPLNRTASTHLAYALGSVAVGDVRALADAVVGGTWVRLNEPQWLAVLLAARDE